MRAFVLLALCFAAVAALPSNQQRIVGGSVTTIDQYPSMASLLYTWNMNTFSQYCGGVIVNTRTILTAAHCPHNEPVNRWRVRIGSTWANSGGNVLDFQLYVIHPNYYRYTYESDLAVMRTATTISYNNNVRPASIAGPNYNLADNQAVWATGWGSTFQWGPKSEQLRHVQIWTVNQNECIRRYATEHRIVSANMLCAGWLDVGGRDQCQGDSGGPLYHNNVLVGVCSWGRGCGNAFFPGVNVRVSRFTSWIQSNA